MLGLSNLRSNFHCKLGFQPLDLAHGRGQGSWVNRMLLLVPFCPFWAFKSDYSICSSLTTSRLSILLLSYDESSYNNQISSSTSIDSEVNDFQFRAVINLGWDPVKEIIAWEGELWTVSSRDTSSQGIIPKQSKHYYVRCTLRKLGSHWTSSSFLKNICRKNILKSFPKCSVHNLFID